MAGKIPSTFIDELMARVDIADVIDRRVPLTRKGREFMACCPFHDEKTPSFTVSPTKQFYHCFGCGAHGTAIGFLMDYGNLGFVDAIEELAAGLGINVPYEAADGRNIQPNKNAADLLTLVDRANHYFQQQLREHPEGRAAIAYLKRRGLDAHTAARFGLGFAPSGSKNLLGVLGKDDESRQQLVKAGLLKLSDVNQPIGGRNQPYDTFRERIIFPIEDHRGRVVAFGGRIIGQGEPKYLNSPETPVFHKSAELYNLANARKSIGDQKMSVIVEGYMDVISLAQHGVSNSVATMGTATTRTHLQRLFRLAPDIVFCFDGDRAGLQAAWRSLQMALPELQDGRQVSYLFLPDGEDPDSMIRSEGEAGFRDRLIDATPLPDFLFDHLTAQVDLTRSDGKARLVNLAQPLIAQIPEGAFQELMSNRLSSITGVTSKALPAAPAPRTRQRRRNQSVPEIAELSFVARATSMLLQYPAILLPVVAREALQQLDIKGIEVLLSIADMIAQRPDANSALLLEHFREHPHYEYLLNLAAVVHTGSDEERHGYFIDLQQRLINENTTQQQAKLLNAYALNPSSMSAEDLEALRASYARTDEPPKK